MQTVKIYAQADSSWIVGKKLTLIQKLKKCWGILFNDPKKLETPPRTDFDLEDNNLLMNMEPIVDYKFVAHKEGSFVLPAPLPPYHPYHKKTLNPNTRN